jgi:hypothetical protein
MIATRWCCIADILSGWPIKNYWMALTGFAHQPILAQKVIGLPSNSVSRMGLRITHWKRRERLPGLNLPSDDLSRLSEISQLLFCVLDLTCYVRKHRIPLISWVTICVYIFIDITSIHDILYLRHGS